MISLLCKQMFHASCSALLGSPSYAINSQAFCSSVDRVVGHRVKLCGLDGRHRIRWGVLTALVALSSYIVANAIPFFKVR